MSPSASLRALLLTSQACDAQIIAAELLQAGLHLEWQWTNNEPDYMALLASPPDFVLCDDRLPKLDALMALKHLHDRHAGIPFLIMSVTPEIDAAVNAIRQGAADYLSRDRLPRGLGGAVRAALRRQQQELQLRRSEERHQSAAALFRNVVEHSLVGIQILQNGKYAYANRKLEELFGYTEDELLALSSWMEVVAEEDRDMVLDQVRRRISGETPHAHYVFRGLRKDGRIIDIEIRSDRTELNGRPAVIGTLIDITERQRTEAILRESEERFRSAFEHTNVAMVLTNLEHRFVKANSAFARLFGYSDDEILTLSMADITHPDSLADSYDSRKPLLAGERDFFQMEKCYLRKDGQILWGLTNVALLRGIDGQPLMFVGQVQDITERKQAAQELQASEARYRSLIEQSIVGFYALQDSRFTYINPKLSEILGFSADELLSHPLADFIAVEDRSVAEEHMHYQFEGTVQSIRDSLRMRRRDGRIVQTEIHSTTTVQNGRPTIIGIVMDVTQQRQAEEERNRFFSISPDLFCIVGFDGRFRRLNPAWGTALGWALEELIDRPYLDIVHPDDREKFLALWENLISHRQNTQRTEIRFRSKDRSYRWHLWNAVSDPRQLLVYSTATDLTASKRLEEQLGQSQKLEAIGRLAGGIAHDFNNLLTVINGYSEILSHELHSDLALRKLSEEIQMAGTRAASLTQQLLAFSRKQVLVPVQLDVNRLLKEMEKLLVCLIGEDIALEFVREPQLWPIRADATQIEQVLMNLAVNARDAMPRGGKLNIEARNRELDETYVAMHQEARPGQYVVLSVSDTGCGMDQSTRTQIFEPFFTTKGDNGTGLGLSTVYGIVKQSGGHIEVYSEIGLGSTFKVYLPRDYGTLSPHPSGPETQEFPHGNETILLVEDSDAVRALARLILQRSGYTVLDARNGNEALSLSRHHSAPIHLLMTDIVMPGMNGRELAEQLQSQRPELKILYISGYTDDMIVRHGILESHMHFMQKPFSSIGLIEKVRTVLDIRQDQTN